MEFASHILGLLSVMLFGGILWYVREKFKNIATKKDIREISFASEKGKNLATKDDIEEITAKVEEVKRIVNLNLHAQTSLWNMDRDALVGFYKKYNFWNSELVDTPSSIALSNNYDRNNHLNYLRDLRSKAKEDYFLALFFVKDDRLMDCMSDLMTDLQKIHEITVQRIWNYEKGRNMSETFENTPEISSIQNNIIKSIAIFSSASLTYLKNKSK